MIEIPLTASLITAISWGEIQMGCVTFLLKTLGGIDQSFFGLLAQVAPSREPTWAGALMEMDTGKLSIILIFGTGLVTAIGYAISGMIRAYHAAPDESEELASQIAALEKRIAELERQHTSSLV